MQLTFKMAPAHILALKALIHLLALGWALLTFYQAINDQLGGDPVEAILHFTGIGAFNLLLLSLLVSPLAKYLKQGLLMRVRRLLGVYAAVYALLHLVSYILFELQLDWSLLLDEIIDRPYITVGFAAILILIALTVTSTQTAQRKMGKAWQSLHNWVYLAVVLVALHYIWSVKSDLVQPVLYWAFTLILLYARKAKWQRWRKMQKKPTKTLA